MAEINTNPSKNNPVSLENPGPEHFQEPLQIFKLFMPDDMTKFTHNDLIFSNKFMIIIIKKFCVTSNTNK